MIFYSHYNSSSCYRVRIALHLKNIPYEQKEVDRFRQGGLNNIPGFRELSPTSEIPVLLEGDFHLSQSQAILEYLEENFPEPALLPKDCKQRAQVREFCQMVACDIHPLNTLRVRKYLEIHMSQDHKTKEKWMHHWLSQGLTFLENLVDKEGGFCFSDQLSMADLFLVPKLYNAREMKLDLSAYPRLLEIEKHCLSLPSFISAHPERQRPIM